jgi:hypothetical protein
LIVPFLGIQLVLGTWLTYSHRQATLWRGILDLSLSEIPCSTRQLRFSMSPLKTQRPDSPPPLPPAPPRHRRDKGGWEMRVGCLPRIKKNAISQLLWELSSKRWGCWVSLFQSNYSTFHVSEVSTSFANKGFKLLAHTSFWWKLL